MATVPSQTAPSSSSSSSPSPSPTSGDLARSLPRIFHGVAPSHRHEVKRVLMNKAILSSTTLQMCLYYNFFYSLAFTWFFILAFRWKYLNFDGLRVTYFTPIFFAIWAIVELLRLYVGYQGNLKEDTPNMAAFLFLTIFPQMLITIYFLAMQVPLYHFDRIFSGLMLAFLCLEFVLGWRLMGTFIADKTARFSVEYGGVETSDTIDDTEVVAFNRYINSDDGGDPMMVGDEFTNANPYGLDNDSMDTGGQSDRRTRRARTIPLANGGEGDLLTPQRTGRATEDELESSRHLIIPSRDGTMSFGGTGVLPLARHDTLNTTTLPPLRASTSSVPRGTALRSTGGGGQLPPLLGATRLPPLGTTNIERELETPAERAARRARDRAIISGQLIPDRRTRRDYEEEQTAIELAAEQERIAAQSAEALERLATNRTVITTAALTSPTSVRIPLIPTLSEPNVNANKKRE